MDPHNGIFNFNPPFFIPFPSVSESCSTKRELFTILENLKILSEKEESEIDHELVSNELIKIKIILDQNKISDESELLTSLNHIGKTLTQIDEKFILLFDDLKEASLDLLSSLFIALIKYQGDFYSTYFNLLMDITGVDFEIEDDVDDENGGNLIISFENNKSNLSLKDLIYFLKNSSVEKKFTLYFKLNIHLEELPVFPAFLVSYGKNIQNLIIDFHINDELADEILFHCKNLDELIIISKKFEGKNLKNLQTLIDLRVLFFKCKNLTSLDIPLPPYLEEIRISRCSNLKKLPSTISSSVKKFYIHHCKKLSTNYRIDYLSHLFTTNIKQGLCLLKGFRIRECERLGNALVQSLSLEKIKLHVDLFKKYMPKEALYPIMAQVLNEDLHFFLNHAQGFPLTNIPSAILNKIPTWVKLNQFTLNLLNFPRKEGEVSEAKAIDVVDQVTKVEQKKEIYLNELLTLFDEINFENDQESCFIPEKYLQIDGDKATIEEIRKGLEKLISNVENLANYTAVPKDLEERGLWYGELKKDLSTIITLSNEPSNKEVYPQELIRLGGAGHQCGTRWRKESKDVISVLKSVSYEFESISDSIKEWLMNYFEAIATEVSFQFKDKIDDIMQPHLFNAICKIMKEMKLPLSETFIIDLNDAYIDSFTSEERREIKEKIHEYLIPLRLAHCIQTKIEELLVGNPIAGEIILNAFKEMVEKELFFQITRLESHFEERKLVCGLKNTQTLLNECLIKKAISENNEVEINKFKSANRMNFIRISQTVAREQAELEEKNKEKGVVNSKKRKAEAPLEEGDFRCVKKARIANEIENSKSELSLDGMILQYQSYIENPKDFEKELKEVGRESAAKEMRMEREAMVSEYLEENKFIEDDLMGNVKPMLEGIIALLKSLNYLHEPIDLQETDGKS